MKVVSFILYFIIVAFFIGCTEKFNLESAMSAKILVVDGLITNNPGPYYIRLTWSQPGINKSSVSFFERFSDDSAEPVKDALIIISDNLGTIDTLKLVPDTSYISFKGLDLYNDTFITKFKINNTGKIGFYQTTKLQGKQGNTYSLKINVNGQVYTSSGFMTPLPVFDSLSYTKKKLEKDDIIEYVPLLYFKKLNSGTNYYLFQFDVYPLSGTLKHQTILPRVSSNNMIWPFYIMSDELLKSYVNGIDIWDGVSVNNNTSTGFTPGSNINLAISSLTEQDFLYYKNLIQQFGNDGAAYKQMPASPHGNISNGALGLFRTSTIIELHKKIKIEN